MRTQVLCLVALTLAIAGCDRPGGGSVDAGTARIEMNEALAVAHLKSIAAAETQAQCLGVVDVDGDGIGEFVFVSELDGARQPRGPGKGLKFPLLGKEYAGRGAGGFVEVDGYLYRVFLPGASGFAVSEGAGAEGKVVANSAEREWLGYAWPVRYGTTGRQTFVLGAGGQIVSAGVPEHTGSSAPQAGAALVEGQGLSRPFRAEYAVVE